MFLKNQGILKKHPDSFSISTLIMNKYKNISSQLPKWLGYIAHVSENVINQNLCTVKFPSVRNTRQKMNKLLVMQQVVYELWNAMKLYGEFILKFEARFTNFMKSVEEKEKL